MRVFLSAFRWPREVLLRIAFLFDEMVRASIPGVSEGEGSELREGTSHTSELRSELVVDSNPKF